MTADRLPQSWPLARLDPRRGAARRLELLTSGAFGPLTGYLATADLTAVASRGELADGTPWPIPVTLTVPLAPSPAAPTTWCCRTPRGRRSPWSRSQNGSRPTRARAPGKLRSGWPDRSPRCARPSGRSARSAGVPARARRAGSVPVLALATRRPLGLRQLGQLRHLADQLRARILLLPLVALPADLAVRPEALVRAVRAAARQLPDGTLVVPCRCRRRAAPPTTCRPVPSSRLPTARPTCWQTPDESRGTTGPFGQIGFDFRKLGLEVLAEGEWAYDPLAEVWRPLGLIEPGLERGELSDNELGELLDSGEPLPAWMMPAGVAAELRRARPPRSARGVVVFCTGLSGSGKSTLARDLRDALLERGDRTVSLLDGDLVRQLLSAGLTFSRRTGT